MLFDVPCPNAKGPLSLQGLGNFGMTTLPYQRGEWGKHVTAVHPKIFVVFDHAKEPTEVLDCSGQGECEVCLYLFCCGFILSVVST